MIKFFRKIRKQMLKQGKTANYLKYAIGEIILVVIGILIALQLNIQKERANEKKVIEELLTGIQTDLKLEDNRIEFLQTYYTNITDGIQNILLHHQEKELYTNQELGQYFLNTFEFRKFSKFNTNYQTLYGSGLLQKIEDKNLTKEIVTYYSTQFLEWSLEIYQQKAGQFNFNKVAQFHPLDKLQTGTVYKNIPNFRLDTSNPYKTDFKIFIKEPEVLNFLVDLLHQSELVYGNLETYKNSNQILSNKIRHYLDQ